MNNSKSFDTRKLVLLALLTAIVVVLQFLGAFIRFGTFSISLVLMPIAVGAALCGIRAGGWLGLVFGFIVLLSGDASPFMAVDPLGAILLVLIKGTLAGLAAGSVYRLLAKISRTLAATLAAVVCPIVNTGIFLIGCYVFFWPTLTEWAGGTDYASTAAFIFLGMIGANFLLELGINLVLSPTIVRLIQYGQDKSELAIAA